MPSDWIYGQSLYRPVSKPEHAPAHQQQRKSVPIGHSKHSFADVLHTKIQASGNQSEIETDDRPLLFSKHAEERLRLRSIQITPDQMRRIQSGIEQVAQKGGKDSLVICGNVSLVVNIPKRTVITALDGTAPNNHVFTNIDSAVIV
ncbi:hypothetical protein LSG31_15835 [Fodinisporobacter ferrooxydans]|uniref:Flagellar protein n=1 Tax=Fodinisporobacter ferrooxydans TaxID=2901836 RepID=A0ABY4CIS9_9BACL|nr:hypothetical protein LSG31_15835 [Alicyclobacillaceae bacterium MYW30-H2]